MKIYYFALYIFYFCVCVLRLCVCGAAQQLKRQTGVAVSVRPMLKNKILELIYPCFTIFFLSN